MRIVKKAENYWFPPVDPIQRQFRTQSPSLGRAGNVQMHSGLSHARCVTGIYRVETKDTVKHPTTHGMAPWQRITDTRMSAVPRISILL